ncbi:MAG: Uma2 family endonuclease [Acidobacteriota bacterium]|nr:Uma2 family endonuclease [Acidobacteriota bacterium]
MPTTTKLITYEDSLTMPEDRFEEIVDGESRIMPPPTPGHWKVLQQVREMLRDQLPQQDYDMSLADVGLGIKRRPVLTYRVPDIAVFSVAALAKDRAESGKSDAYIWAVPELVVECLSPSNRKGPTEKLRQNYESIGVPEVWFIDLQSETLTVYLLESGSLVEKQSIKEGMVIPVRLPQVSVNVNDLWKAFDF